jgi:hypothetical protein
VIACGESNRAGLEDFMAFGSLSEGEVSPEDNARFQSVGFPTGDWAEENRRAGPVRPWSPSPRPSPL